jgi:hypothetical protein
MRILKGTERRLGKRFRAIHVHYVFASSAALTTSVNTSSSVSVREYKLLLPNERLPPTNENSPPTVQACPICGYELPALHA